MFLASTAAERYVALYEAENDSENTSYEGLSWQNRRESGGNGGQLSLEEKPFIIQRRRNRLSREKREISEEIFRPSEMQREKSLEKLISASEVERTIPTNTR